MDNNVVEILQYTLHTGTGTEFHNIMRNISVPLHRLHGIDVISFGNSLHDPDSYYLIRAFDSEDRMNSVLEAFYSSDDWHNGPRKEIINRIESSIKTVINMPCDGLKGLRIPV